MADGSWDNSGAPSPKPGMPLWGKITLGCCGGCALVSVLVLVTCVGGVRWVARHGVPEAVDRAVGSAFLDKAWQEMDRTVRSLRTVEGTRELYRANPGLAECYPTEEEFLKEAEGWRSRLGEFPTQRPKLNDLIRHEKGGGSFTVNTRNSTTRIEYQIPNGGRLYLQMESDRLVDVRVE